MTNKLILISLLNFVLNYIYKNNRFFKTVVNKVFNFFLNNGLIDNIFNFLFILLHII